MSADECTVLQEALDNVAKMGNVICELREGKSGLPFVERAQKVWTQRRQAGVALRILEIRKDQDCPEGGSRISINARFSTQMAMWRIGSGWCLQINPPHAAVGRDKQRFLLLFILGPKSHPSSNNVPPLSTASPCCCRIACSFRRRIVSA